MYTAATQVMKDNDEDQYHPPPRSSRSKTPEKIHQVGFFCIGAKKYPVFEGINKVGRNPDCDINIVDLTVSKNHAEIEANPKSAFVCDLESANKTRLNNEIIKPNRFYQVVDGAMLKFGIIEGQYLFLRDLDDSIIVPETPDYSSRYRRSNESVRESKGKNNQNDDSIVVGSQEQKDSLIFAKPTGRASTSRVTNRGKSVQKNLLLSIHDAETQRQDDDEESKTSIHDLETQKPDDSENITATEPSGNKMKISSSIHDLETQKVDNVDFDPDDILSMETQKSDDNSEISCEQSCAKRQLIKPKTSSIHDLETQRVDNVDLDTDDIMSMQTQKDEDNLEISHEESRAKKTLLVKSPTASIHNLETQKIDDIDFDRDDILSMETQKDDVDTSKISSEKSRTAGHLIKPKTSSIHDLETQKLNADDHNHMSIEDMETQCIDDKQKDEGKIIHELATSTATVNRSIAKNFKNNEIQQLINGKIENIIAETDESDTDEEGVFDSVLKNGITPQKSPKDIRAVLDSDSETDEEGSFENLASKELNVSSKISIDNVANESLSKPKSSSPVLIEARQNEDSNDDNSHITESAQRASKIDPVHSPDRMFTPSPTLDDDSMAPTQIINREINILKNSSTRDINKTHLIDRPKIIAEKHQDSDDEMASTQIIQPTTQFCGTKTKIMSDKTNIIKSEDEEATQLLSNVTEKKAMKHKEVDSNDEPTQLIHPVCPQNQNKSKKRNALDTSDDDSTDSDSWITKKNKLRTTPRRSIPANKTYSARKLNSSKSAKEEKSVTASTSEVSALKFGSKLKSTDSLDDSISRNLRVMFDGANDEKIEEPPALMTQQLVNILKPADSQEISDDDSDAAELSGFSNGVAVSSTKTPDNSIETEVDVLTKRKSPITKRTKTSRPLDSYGSDSSDDAELNYEDLKKIADGYLASPKEKNSLRNQIINETFKTMKGTSSVDKCGSLPSIKIVRVSAIKKRGATVDVENNISDELPKKRARKTPGRYTTSSPDPEALEVEAILKKTPRSLPAKQSRTNNHRQEKINESTTSDTYNTPVKSKKSKTEFVDSPSSSVRSRMQHKVVLTGLNDDDSSAIRRAVAQLGGTVTDDPAKATVLITDKVRRTIKFFCAVSRSIPIVSMKWIDACNRDGAFVDFDQFILKDRDAEARYNFELKQSLMRAKEKVLLEGYTFIITSKVNQPNIKDLKRMIDESGGKALVRAPKQLQSNTIIISCNDDIPRVKKLLSNVPDNLHVPVVSTEFILSGILKQELDAEAFTLKI